MLQLLLGQKGALLQDASKGVYAFVDLPLDSPEKQAAYILEIEVTRNLNLIGGVGDFHVTYGYLQESRHFIDCNKRDEEPKTSFEDAVKTMELVERVAESSVSLG